MRRLFFFLLGVSLFLQAQVLVNAQDKPKDLSTSQKAEVPATGPQLLPPVDELKIQRALADEAQAEVSVRDAREARIKAIQEVMAQHGCVNIFKDPQSRGLLCVKPPEKPKPAPKEK